MGSGTGAFSGCIVDFRRVMGSLIIELFNDNFVPLVICFPRGGEVIEVEASMGDLPTRNGVAVDCDCSTRHTAGHGL